MSHGSHNHKNKAEKRFPYRGPGKNCGKSKKGPKKKVQGGKQARKRVSST